ncbi:hypothetical protein M378DRAFT_11157 [Amanita muscaria Koide BX008]|uniref:Uncharacterized protein n=1 Tax=Amanita muscaria (strain Koide BX008) TaxID=946122 RepID=A0A0C2SNJ6_AMAMK|nr:hypothetical protein M378DRAFT_11157 [Amanita muscaria Koide BX008]
MSTLWHILRDRCLRSVLRKLEGTTSNFSPPTSSSRAAPFHPASPLPLNSRWLYIRKNLPA